MQSHPLHVSLSWTQGQGFCDPAYWRHKEHPQEDVIIYTCSLFIYHQDVKSGNVTLFSSLLACCTHHVGVVTALLKAGTVCSGSGISSCFSLLACWLIDLNSLPCTQAQTWMQWTCEGWPHYTLHCPDWGSLGAVKVKIPQRAFHSQERKKLLR